MELDSQSLDSDEGVELSIRDNEEMFPPDFAYAEETESTVLEAKTVYLLLPKSVPVSRTARLQWLLDHLNAIIKVPVLQKWNDTSRDLEVVSVIPREQPLSKCNRYQINSRTEVIFLAHTYRLVYCLDMSPSQAIVDIQKGEILFDEILTSFKTSVEGLVRQFTIPGNSLIFQPTLYLTVMANTPFFMSPAQQVLVKGVQIAANNLQEVISFVQNQFHLLEKKIADVTTAVHEQNETQKMKNEGIVGGLFDLPDNDKINVRTPMVSPDANFVNMLRYSMLAVSLLPENSISHILVITDGVVAMPDSNIMESLLFQLHYDSIAVSFVKVGSSFHPHSSSGYISYDDLLNFISHSTMGTCLENSPDIHHEPSMSMNMYHELFLLWSFHSAIRYDYRRTFDITKWRSPNDTFYSYKTPILLSKKQTDENTSASILLLLTRRMREGFVVDTINYINGLMEIQLSLQWKSFIYIIYKVSSQWPVVKNNTHLEVFVSAPYEFLHDITCEKDSKSLYRQAIIERFWMRLSQLSSGDLNFAQQLSVFQNSNVWYTLPESVRSGIPVFILNSPYTDSHKLLLAPSSTTSPKFINAWQPICQMDASNWRKWFHTRKISLILKHDSPLPKHLHLPNSSQRFQVVQCRQAATALHGKLAEWASFVLIDSHTYLKLLEKEPNKPTFFCIVRISSKFPCAVLNIGFATKTPGNVRHDTCEDLKNDLASLSYMPSPGKTKENVCCILQKPLEKILIRYERMPTDFSTVVFPDGTQPPHATLNVPSPLTSSLFTTLTRYLYHKRWIWSASHCASSRLLDHAISRILSALTRMRLEEGFVFAYSSSGIITMVLELWMEPEATCVVQYVLFPPHHAGLGDDWYSGSEEENDAEIETETELQIVTEVWIEPQYGKVKPSNNSRINYMNHKHYYELADVISEIDLQCINSLLTMEHLSLMCQEKNRSLSVDTAVNFGRPNSTNSKTSTRKNSKINMPDLSIDVESQWYPIVTPRIEHIPFKFDPINILPLCQQSELLFSMFIERKEMNLIDSGSDRSNKLLLDNIQEHLSLLHDDEIALTKEECDRFTKHILIRHKDKNMYPCCCPISDYKSNSPVKELPNSQWRCFIKGISITHVILTFIPATLSDLKGLIQSDSTNIPSLHDSTESMGRSSSRESNYSDVPINVASSLTLPVYVYDCPLASNLGEPFTRDVYEDHRFKSFESIQDDCLRAKLDDSSGSPENKGEDYEMPQNKSSARQHCKTLVLVHSKCFTVSLFMALHRGLYVHCMDVQSAVDQCEEAVSEIDITDYILTVCGHVKHHKEDKVDVQQLRQTTPCNDLKSLHALIKNNFFKIISDAFIPIPTNEEFYFCRHFSSSKIDSKLNNSSDDDISNPPSDKEFNMYQDNNLQRHESENSDINTSDISPLFLHLVCTMKFNNGAVSNTSVRVLPTCLGELTESMDVGQIIEKKKLQVTLDILCLTLPPDVQNIILEYSTQGLRTKSFCSDGFQPSIASTTSDVSFNPDFPEPLANLPEYQRKAIISLREEIKWILKDEIATALLDVDGVNTNTLNFVIKHVFDNKNRSSCTLYEFDLNFVFDSAESHRKFVEEFAKIKVAHFKLLEEDQLYYLAKDNDKVEHNNTNGFMESDGDNMQYLRMNKPNYDDKLGDDIGSQHSDISSVSESYLGTEDGTGYDEDVSNDDEDYEWLVRLDNKRAVLPNFWLIMKIEQEAVKMYFHCRFLELPDSQSFSYTDVQGAIREEIQKLCKKVNQSLLLQSLYESRICHDLLEPDDNIKDWPSNVGASPAHISRLKSMEEASDEYDMTSSVALSEASQNFTPGYFRCPVVWQTHFVLNPRLKTGPGKSGISRGILALKNILEKFSVSNRNNMFVYRDNKSNVFYLRLQENVQNSSGRTAPLRSNEYENAIVSRSPSIASLPLSQPKHPMSHYEHNLSSMLANEIRPRVRSFGEKESKDGPSEDTLILKVHGITETGTDVQCDLVQVLKNRLDDAVLDFLSVMLARNAMCPLTPEDVHFIQKPFRLPEVIIRLTMQEFVLQWMDSFIHYLKQNLLQFLNIPKYIDNRSDYHFKDYSESEQGLGRNSDDNIFVYNQSQNPSSGSRGIACIALAVVYKADTKQSDNLRTKFDEVFRNKAFPNMVTSKILDDKSDPKVHLEFRLWKQGRVNIDNLSIKLREAISQATWDIIMEYQILKAPLCEDNKNLYSETVPINITSGQLNLTKEIEFNCLLDVSNKDNVRYASKRKLEPLFLTRKRNRRVNPPTAKATRSITFDERDKENYTIKQTNPKPLTKLNSFETGEDGVLSVTYSTYLPSWLEFGSTISAPSVRKHKIPLTNNHLPGTTIKELLNCIQDSPKAFRSIPLSPLCSDSDEIFVPYDAKKCVKKCVIISRNFDNWKASTGLTGTADYPDSMSPQALKHTQKFVPATINNKFVPRQKIVWVMVESDSIIIYTYNWARDNVDKLISTCTKLGQWLSMRSCFLNSVTAQKLGLFHNQAITQKSFRTSNNPYTWVIDWTPHIMEFPREDTRKSLPTVPNLSSMLEAFRDSFHTSRYNTHDAVGVFTVEMQEMKLAEKKSREEMKKLHSMYQSRTSTTTVSQIFLLMQNSRIIHYCHTPLLFLPCWRLKSAATRDHSLCPTQTRRTSKIELEKDSWHTELCYGFLCEYRRYLQTLGFMPLQIDNTNRKTGIWARDNSSYNSVFYIQKTIMGGILLFTVEFNEPFFTTILHAIECNRLQSVTSRESINRFTLSFLDECDRVKILMHLHSFTYDYHLRCIYSYISNAPVVNKVCDRYNVNQFFDDFMTYYNKAPNFARNLIHADTITIKDLVTEGKQLYDYLLTNVGQYNFKILDMERPDGDLEYILVQVTSTPQVSYKDSQDRHHTDDFEITLIVYNLCTPYRPTDNVLHLKYYLILTSKSEIYPKIEVEQTLGKFRTVSSGSKSLTTLEKLSSDLEASANRTSDSDCDLANSDDHVIPSSNDDQPPNQTQPNVPHVEISEESVNYLGYYSSHEQLMQQMILDKANTTQRNIMEMVAQGMIHCRIHLLWNKLVQPQESNTLTYDEFMELKSLAKLDHLCDVNPNLGPLLNQSLAWYQGLAKRLLVKYSDHNRSFISQDGNIQHFVILHPHYFGAFMLLSIDLHTARGDLYAVYREPHKQEDPDLCLVYRKALLDGFVNCICFYLWSGMI